MVPPVSPMGVKGEKVVLKVPEGPVKITRLVNGVGKELMNAVGHPLQTVRKQKLS